MLILVQQNKDFSNGAKIMLLVLYHAQSKIYLWYDMAYSSENGMNFVLLWYDMAYLNDNNTNFVCTVVLFVHFRLSY